MTVVSYSRAEVAERAGITLDEVTRLIELGIIAPAQDDRFSAGAVRKAVLANSLEQGGVSLDASADAFRTGRLSLDFLDNPAFENFAALSGLTFQALSNESGVPVELLMVIREAIGSAMPNPSDRVREDELHVVPMVQAQLRVGYPVGAIERSLRIMGDSLRRYTLTEADAFRAHVIEPVSSRPGIEIGAAAGRATEQLAGTIDAALLAIYHAQEARAWTANMIDGFERSLAEAGVSGRVERPPAMCFLDITGYTRLTQERGDEAAATLSTQVVRLVQRTSVQHGGRPIKWLGDGVMFFFPKPGPGVVAALDMIDGVAAAGLPPAHVGLHAGPVVFQDGDYYGQTVNVASRIAEFARSGEVLVSEAVVEASAETDVAFRDLGPVELKGVAGAMRLHAASRTAA